MKRITTLALLISSVGYGQTNIFPSSGNVGIGTTSPGSNLEVVGKTSVGLKLNGTSTDYEALSIFNTPAANLPSGNGAVIQFYNNCVNYNGVVGASIKSLSVNNQYGWESDLYLRTTRNNGYSSQTIIDALVVKGGSGNVGIGTSSAQSRLSLRASTNSQGLTIGNVDAVGTQTHFGLTTADQSSIGLATESYFNIYNDGFWHFNSGNTSGSTLPITLSTDCIPRLFIEPGGNVGIGTTTLPAGYKLAVYGKIISEEIVVKLKGNWPDYVFEKDYKLPSLEELQLFIAEHKHLPDVPSAKEVEENGLAIGEMNAVLLKKIEELTLYLIESNKKIENQQLQIDQLNRRIDEKN